MTIRRWIVTVGIVVALTGIRGSACGVIYSFIDTPTDGSVIKAADFRVVGWSFECASGRRAPVPNVAFWNLNTHQWWRPHSFKIQPQPRHDVALYFRVAHPECALSDATGYVATVTPAPPPGHYLVWVAWANYYGAQDSQARDIDIAYD